MKLQAKLIYFSIFVLIFSICLSSKFNKKKIKSLIEKFNNSEIIINSNITGKSISIPIVKKSLSSNLEKNLNLSLSGTGGSGTGGSGTGGSGTGGSGTDVFS